MKIYLWGIMGSGKSTTGRTLAGRLGWQFLDTDAVIEAREEMSINRIFETKGAPYFRQIEHEILLETIPLAQTIIATGGGLPCFHGNADLMLEHGTCVWLYAPLPVILQRLEQTSDHRPMLRGKRPEDIAQLLAQLMLQRRADYARAPFTVAADSPDIIGALLGLT